MDSSIEKKSPKNLLKLVKCQQLLFGKTWYHEFLIKKYPFTWTQSSTQFCSKKQKFKKSHQMTNLFNSQTDIIEWVEWKKI